MGATHCQGNATKEDHSPLLLPMTRPSPDHSPLTLRIHPLVQSVLELRITPPPSQNAPPIFKMEVCLVARALLRVHQERGCLSHPSPRREMPRLPHLVYSNGDFLHFLQKREGSLHSHTHKGTSPLCHPKKVPLPLSHTQNLMCHTSLPRTYDP